MRPRGESSYADLVFIDQRLIMPMTHVAWHMFVPSNKAHVEPCPQCCDYSSVSSSRRRVADPSSTIFSPSTNRACGAWHLGSPWSNCSILQGVRWSCCTPLLGFIVMAAPRFRVGDLVRILAAFSPAAAEGLSEVNFREKLPGVYEVTAVVRSDSRAVQYEVRHIPGEPSRIVPERRLLPAVRNV
jgi:hypothetical protein